LLLGGRAPPGGLGCVLRHAHALFVHRSERRLRAGETLLGGEAKPWPSPFAQGIDEVLACRGRQVCVLASGDPFFYGVGSVLAAHVPPEETLAVPARFRYAGRKWSYDGLSCPLAGRHQLINAACALALLEAAAEPTLPVSEAAVREGLRRVRWGGRLETVDSRPRIVLDGAHNPDAASVVAAYVADLRRERPGSRVILVVGIMRDKDRQGFLDRLLPHVDDVITTQVRHPRAATAHELGASLHARGVPAHVVPDPADAIARARGMAASDDLILITGSLMLVGEAKAILLGCGLSPLRG